ncbi:hypothetical protein PR048_029346 [Dryococelus australis]|uniref:Uncharacterized protein n=1 Tax=Dryococelus australis TaxID=614101 RepID=A0ABQ9GD38_9NEOP|nr:hypothetical protein PR048_029346 [Dryococelus australis]
MVLNKEKYRLERVNFMLLAGTSFLLSQQMDPGKEKQSERGRPELGRCSAQSARPSMANIAAVILLLATSLNAVGGGRGVVVDRALASHHGDPGSIPGAGSLPEFRTVGVVPDDADCRRAFSGVSRPPRPLLSGAAPYSPRLALIGSRDLDVKTSPNLFASLAQ